MATQPTVSNQTVICRTCGIEVVGNNRKEIEKEDEYGVETYEVCMNCGDSWVIPVSNS